MSQSSAVAFGQAAASTDAATEAVELPAGCRMLGAILGTHFGKAGDAQSVAIFGELLKAGYLVVPTYNVEEAEARHTAPHWSTEPVGAEFREAGHWERSAPEEVLGARDVIFYSRVWLSIQYGRTLTLHALNVAQLEAIKSARAAITKPGSFAADLAQYELRDRQREREAAQQRDAAT